MEEKKIIELVNLSKSYGKENVLKDLSLYIREGEFLTLLGPSGCGKTTTLKMIGGFINPDSGQILFDGKDITNLPPNKRPVNTVFQKYALFPHMNVYDNIAFGLKIQKLSKLEIARRIGDVLEMVGLSDFDKRNVTDLSGGQQQRVAIARAIVNKPHVLLLDEPLGALDLKMRQNMQYELKNIHKQTGITFVYVTHDQEEALTLSDTIVVMNQGIIQQIGTPEDIYNEPKNAFVADFIGDSNLFDAIMVKDRVVRVNGIELPCVDIGFGTNKPVDITVRPEDVELRSPNNCLITGTVTSLIFKGVHYEMEVEANGLTWLIHSTKMEPIGTKVGLFIEPENIQIMNKPQSEDEEVVVDEE